MSGMEDDFEIELRKGLRRAEAPASLADAIIGRVVEKPRRAPAFPLSNTWVGRLAALFLLTATLAGAGVIRFHHRRVTERNQAERDFAKSQELTSRALEPVRQHLRRAGVALDE